MPDTQLTARERRQQKAAREITRLQTKCELLTTRELRHVLKVSTPVVRQLAREGRIPSMKIGGGYRFDPHDVIEALKADAKIRRAQEDAEGRND